MNGCQFTHPDGASDASELDPQGLLSGPVDLEEAASIMAGLKPWDRSDSVRRFRAPWEE